MALEWTSWVNGVSASAVWFAATILGILCFRGYFKTHKPLKAVVGVLIISFSFFYLGPFADFWSLFLFQTNITPELYALLSYTVGPVSVTAFMYLGFSVFNPKWKKTVVYIFLGTGIFYWIALYGWTSSMLALDPLWTVGQMIDIGLRSIALYYILTYIILIVIVLAGGFIRLYKRLEGNYKILARNFAIGFLSFGVGAIIDSAIPNELIVIARIFMFLFLSFVYLGSLSPTLNDGAESEKKTHERFTN